MEWGHFLFWSVWRTFLAVLFHLNWAITVYTNCVYFTLWKSFDLLYFWTHLLLCICFASLRSENYLLVWCNLIRHKNCKHVQLSYKQIYQLVYGEENDRGERLTMGPERELDTLESKEGQERLTGLESSELEREEEIGMELKQSGGGGGERVAAEGEKAPEGGGKMRTIANVIEVYLQVLRIMCSQTILMGNVIRTLLPANKHKFLRTDEPAFENPLLRLILQMAVYLDVAMFMVYALSSFWIHRRRCCGLGFIRFFALGIIFELIGIFVMMLPASIVLMQLDRSLCQFRTNSSLYAFQPNWHYQCNCTWLSFPKNVPSFGP